MYHVVGHTIILRNFSKTAITMFGTLSVTLFKQHMVLEGSIRHMFCWFATSAGVERKEMSSCVMYHSQLHGVLFWWISCREPSQPSVFGPKSSLLSIDWTIDGNYLHIPSAYASSFNPIIGRRISASALSRAIASLILWLVARERNFCCPRCSSFPNSTSKVVAFSFCSSQERHYCLFFLCLALNGS